MFGGKLLNSIFNSHEKVFRLGFACLVESVGVDFSNKLLAVGFGFGLNLQNVGGGKIVKRGQQSDIKEKS